MKELESDLRDDLSDISDNAPEEELKFISELDKDRLEFEWMLENMKNDMMFLKDDLAVDEEEELEQQMKEEAKHETAVITPQLIE